jgi:hypothetical protein|tara:strand:- start:110 stop:520 length:411 start_codon:yes stop_codon:yes gene_type:complete
MVTLFKGNTIETNWQGLTKVEFSDGSSICYTLPTVSMAGVMWGDRITELIGEMKFFDSENKLECVLKFNPYLKTGVESLFQSRTVSDHVRGEIKSTTTGQILSVAEGSWLDGLQFDHVPLWEMRRDCPSKITKFTT